MRNVFDGTQDSYAMRPPFESCARQFTEKLINQSGAVQLFEEKNNIKLFMENSKLSGTHQRDAHQCQRNERNKQTNN